MRLRSCTFLHPGHSWRNRLSPPQRCAALGRRPPGRFSGMSWPGGSCPSFGEQMPRGMLHCRYCHTELAGRPQSVAAPGGPDHFMHAAPPVRPCVRPGPSHPPNTSTPTFAVAHPQSAAESTAADAAAWQRRDYQAAQLVVGMVAISCWPRFAYRDQFPARPARCHFNCRWCTPAPSRITSS